MSLDFNQILSQPEYNFLSDDSRLKDKVILLGLGGSYAYGTNKEGSDIDFRGVSLRPQKDILTGVDHRQIVVQDKEHDVDTTVYTLSRYIEYATDCNPHCIELLGNDRTSGYAIISPAGQMLLDNRKLFLSQRVSGSFIKNADTQLRRLSNKAARQMDQAEHEKHVLNSMKRQVAIYNDKFKDRLCQYLRLYLDDAVTEGLEKEIFLDIRLQHFPLRRWQSLVNDFVNIVTSYDKLGCRNSKAIEHDKIDKHMMHLIRVYITGIDILESGDIVTCRKQEHNLLMDILNGKYTDSKSQPLPEFFDLVNELSKRMEYAQAHTELPQRPNEAAIKDLHFEINRQFIVNS